MKSCDTSRLRVTNIIVAVLILAVCLMMFMPFWHYDEESVSINGYVWFPTEHSSLETYLEGELGYKTEINQIIRMPIIMFVTGWIGIFLCFFKLSGAWQMICSLPFGVCGFIGFITCGALRLGNLWWLMMLLCIAVVLVDIVGLILSFKE